MTNTTQKQIVLKQLQENGTVSRNWALQNYISRLSALIHILKEDGYKIEPVHKNRKINYEYRIVR
jgi:hypothetical protein